MKKIITLVLALMLVFALVACGDTSKTSSDNSGDTSKTPSDNSGDTSKTPSDNSDDTEINPASSQDETSETPSDSNEADLTTVDSWLTNWGLTENDLKCAHFTRLDKTAYNIDTLVITSVGAYCDTKLAEEEVRAWFDQILTKLNSMSAEGKIVNKLDNNAELTVDYIMENGQTYLYTATGNFTYNGKDTSVLISVAPGQLDNADPDEAMAACMIELHH